MLLNRRKYAQIEAPLLIFDESIFSLSKQHLQASYISSNIVYIALPHVNKRKKEISITFNRKTVQPESVKSGKK